MVEPSEPKINNLGVCVMCLCHHYILLCSIGYAYRISIGPNMYKMKIEHHLTINIFAAKEPTDIEKSLWSKTNRRIHTDSQVSSAFV